MSDYLSRAELHELTDRQRSDAQARILTEMKIPFVMGGAGFPKVLRAEVERRLSAAPHKALTKQPPKPHLHLVR